MEKTPQSNRDSIMSNLELPKPGEGSKKWSLEAESDEEEDANGKADKVAEEVEEEKIESDDEDPLDKYMSEINTEVR